VETLLRESPSHTVGLEQLTDIMKSLRENIKGHHPTQQAQNISQKTLKIQALTLSKLKQPTERAH